MSAGSEEPVLIGQRELAAERPGTGRGITARESGAILVASAVTAVSALGATVIAQYALPAGQVSEFLVFWSLLFGLYGVIAGIQQEATRAVGAARLSCAPGGEPMHRGGEGADGARPGARVVPVAVGIGALLAVLVALSSPAWADDQVPSGSTRAVLLVCLGVCLYAVHAAMSGAAAGRQRWYQFAGLGGGEAAWRLLAMLGVGAAAGTLGGLEAAVVSPVLLWAVLVLLSREGRRTFAARADVPPGRLTRNTFLAMGSSAASAVLMVGFPMVLKATEGEHPDQYRSMVLGVLILGISITRSPIMIPLQAFQGVAISAFLRQRHRPLAAMLRPAAALLGIGLLGGGLAWVIGPVLFRLIYRPQPEQVRVYDDVVHGWLLGPLTFASAIMALLVLTGTAVLALGAHRTYVLGWAVAAVVAVGLLLLPLGLIPRAMIALYLAPACGVAVHLVGMVRAARRYRIQESSQTAVPGGQLAARS